jgi:hypothetical protein
LSESTTDRESLLGASESLSSCNGDRRITSSPLLDRPGVDHRRGILEIVMMMSP